ncbi:hypothetical protein [Thermogemmatispora sp.]|uniref:hypothetical protein n=1 Tax=Thermogemmatispora sp. TaxID=1968838 RepID=UPI002636630D|nr:hypothetical protein [Thermogemmatispora sp.]
MERNNRRLQWIPPWEMPADPIKAVFWFLYWLLRVVVRFYWLPLLAGVIYEGLLNGLIGGGITLLLGLALWVALFAVLRIVELLRGVAQVLATVEQLQQEFSLIDNDPLSRSSEGEPRNEPRVVEGTIVYLDEKRRERGDRPGAS